MIPALPKLLDLVDVKGRTVTADALCAQRGGGGGGGLPTIPQERIWSFFMLPTVARRRMLGRCPKPRSTWRQRVGGGWLLR